MMKKNDHTGISADCKVCDAAGYVEALLNDKQALKKLRAEHVAVVAERIFHESYAEALDLVGKGKLERVALRALPTTISLRVDGDTIVIAPAFNDVVDGKSTIVNVPFRIAGEYAARALERTADPKLEARHDGHRFRWLVQLG